MKKPGRKPKAKPVTVAGVTIIEVANPLYNRAHGPDKTNPQKIPAQFNRNESYVSWLWCNGHIDNSEYDASNRLRAAYERMGGSGASAIDYSREHVDGGQIAQTITDGHLAASRTLKDALGALGPAGYDLALKLAAHGHWPASLTKVDTQRIYLGRRFKECLDTLAVHWGMKMRPIRAERGLTLNKT